ncbi:hypothetical protein CDAR_54741 [Caerostris darwini]|uniref:Secreted protein n=1 Tax=Caerostris darwini TaxID=1538125 RepID=A0AAV4S3T8_9ARAC|nr:hypothetical protein CDAR_54741 [Caerostris darwini]
MLCLTSNTHAASTLRGCPSSATHHKSLAIGTCSRAPGTWQLSAFQQFARHFLPPTRTPLPIWLTRAIASAPHTSSGDIVCVCCSKEKRTLLRCPPIRGCVTRL